jgi:Ca2+-binding RTX toxin-like protein
VIRDPRRLPLIGAALIAPILALGVASTGSAQRATTAAANTATPDAVGPEANPTVSPDPNGFGWHRGPATVVWNWTDQGDGIDSDHCPDQSTTSGEGELTVAATCSDLARNETTATHTVKVDSTAPVVTVTSPGNRRYRQGSYVGVEYRCGDPISGVSVCDGPPAEPIDTSTPGRYQFTVTGRDKAGNQRTVTVGYTVVAVPTCHGRPATIVGTLGNDMITGTRGPDVIVTGGGRDWVRARGGNDTICTGVARDVITAGAGADTVDTGPGRDNAIGGVGNDTVTGRANADILTGGLGADTLQGNTGGDTLIGHDGNDHLDGGPDTDTCRGGAGTDEQTTCELTLGIP